jgi:hypothetical protein
MERSLNTVETARSDGSNTVLQPIRKGCNKCKRQAQEKQDIGGALVDESGRAA